MLGDENYTIPNKNIKPISIFKAFGYAQSKFGLIGKRKKRNTFLDIFILNQ